MDVQPKNETSPSSPAPAGRPKVVLHVKPRQENGKDDWGVGYDPDPDDCSKAEVYLPKGSGAHEIEFRLVGAGPHIKFDLDDPIWVSEGKNCPRTASKHTQIEVVLHKSNERKLVVADLNEGNARVLSYQLNFIGADPCDPRIRNGGSL